MSYISENVLDNDDQIIIAPEKNPMFIVLSWVWGILGFWLLLIPTIKAIAKTVKYCNTEYAVTTKKVIEKYGWVATHTDEMPFSKVENITVTYTFWGKLFNYGNICIQGANRNNINFSCIKNAQQYKKEISKTVGL